MAGLGRCDPTGGTVGSADLSVEGGGQLQGDEGSAGPPMVEVARIDLFGVDTGHPDHRLYPAGAIGPRRRSPPTRGRGSIAPTTTRLTPEASTRGCIGGHAGWEGERTRVTRVPGSSVHHAGYPGPLSGDG